jgi:ubiquinone/menaquinone biosynthesis C-methylase UbiE
MNAMPKIWFFNSYFLILTCCANAQPATNAAAPAALYSYREDHDPDGIGKFYQGREIAHVMGHQVADWLERPERMAEERPDLLLQAIHLRPGDVVADIGAGTGYLSWRMAEMVGNTGRVYANDIQPEMLDLIAHNMADHHTTNVQTVLGTITDAQLPTNALDLVIMVDVYHEFDHPYEMLQSIVRALKPDGRVVWVEYRKEDPRVPIKPLHKMAEAQVRKEAAPLPLQWVQTIEILPRQHIIIFKKGKL